MHHVLPSVPRLSPNCPSPPRSAWTSRGYLPHFDAARVIQHITFRLADSLPDPVLRRIEFEARHMADSVRANESVRRIHSAIDEGHGCCLLRVPFASSLVQRAILHFDGDRYRVLAWVVMPNHVHVVIETDADRKVSAIVGSWKSYTGRRLAERMRQETAGPASGAVWHREHFDRFVRHDAHLEALVAYVEGNPVSAGLVAHAWEWPWGSAAAREAGAWRARGTTGVV